MNVVINGLRQKLGAKDGDDDKMHYGHNEDRLADVMYFLSRCHRFTRLIICHSKTKGLPRHLNINMLCLLTIADEQATGRNHRMNSIHIVVNVCAEEGPVRGII